MPIYIKDPQTSRLARELAQRSGESITEVVRKALQAEAGRVADIDRHPPMSEPVRISRDGPNPRDIDIDEVERVLNRIWSLPVLDDRPADQLLDYDDAGLPR